MSSLMIRDIAALVTCNDADEELHHVDLFCENGRIAAIGPELTQHADRVINGAGMFCYPGLINTHHHLYQQFSRNLAKVQNLAQTALRDLEKARRDRRALFLADRHGRADEARLHDLL